MKITPCGAVGEVTGSGYLVETARARVLVDFGLFQGRGANFEKNRNLGPVDPARLDSVVLTHAHLDHCGRLPLLVGSGYAGEIHATPATIDFTKLILEDSARIQEGDAERENREREGTGEPPFVPLYLPADVDALDARFAPLVYDRPREVAPGVEVRFVDAGHILGSASIEMTVREADGGEAKTIAFSGDVGSAGAPFICDPVRLEAADLVFLESTYGDRDHRSLAATVEEFQGLLEEAAWNKTKVLIPAFAIGRTQQLLYHIAALVRTERVPRVPIYLDSPLATRATEVYEKHQNLFDEEAKKLMERHQLRKDLSQLHFTESSQESRALNDLWESAIIIAGSGMCDGGRIVHHLRHNLGRKNVAVMMVGYMAVGSRGRQLVDGAPSVSIFGRHVEVRARIHTLGGFSAHAGQSELVRWVEPLMATRPRVVLTHGEDRARNVLAPLLHQRFGAEVLCPVLGDTIEL